MTLRKKWIKYFSTREKNKMKLKFSNISQQDRAERMKWNLIKSVNSHSQGTCGTFF